MAGRPKLHPNQADKQFAYRQRQRAKHADELAAWSHVRDAATATGLLIGDETAAEAAQKIAAQMSNTNQVPQGTQPQMLRIDDIRTDGGTNARVFMSSGTVGRHRELLRQNTQFPPVIVFYDGQEYWMADGFHRVAAARSEGIETIAADVRQGTKRDAILYAVGANAAHGLPRNNADRQFAEKLKASIS